MRVVKAVCSVCIGVVDAKVEHHTDCNGIEVAFLICSKCNNIIKTKQLPPTPLTKEEVIINELRTVAKQIKRSEFRYYEESIRQLVDESREP